MSELALILLELAESTAWGDMEPAERAQFDEWVKSGVTGQDVALLLWEAHRRWRRPRHSSSSTFAAVQQHAAPVTDRPPSKGKGKP